MIFAIAFLAGLIRGYTGFGFAMLLALGLMLKVPPAQAVPVALLLDIVCSAALWRGAVRAVDKPALLRLSLGMLLAVPLGVWLLATVPATQMAPWVALLCLFGGVMVLWRPQSAGSWSAWWALPAGLASGLATSVASAGGPPLIIYLLRSGLNAAQVRGTAVLFFLLSSIFALIGLGIGGVLTRVEWSLAGWLLLPALAGNLAGQWLHPRWQPLPLHWLLGSVLVLLASGSLLRALLLA